MLGQRGGGAFGSKGAASNHERFWPGLCLLGVGRGGSNPTAPPPRWIWRGEAQLTWSFPGLEHGIPLVKLRLVGLRQKVGSWRLAGVRIYQEWLSRGAGDTFIVCRIKTDWEGGGGGFEIVFVLLPPS